MNATIVKTSHIQSRRDAAERCMRHVMRLLEWSQDRYCWYKYETGLQYLQIYLQGDVEIIAQVERTKTFWGWWKNHWTIREEEFVSHAQELSNISLLKRKIAYKNLHSPKVLADDFNTAKRMYEEGNIPDMYSSYDNMIYMALKEAESQKNVLA